MPSHSKEFDRQAPPDRGASSFIYPPTPANLAFFANILKAGGLVSIPTETVYGLAALALDESACRKIFTIKGRPLLDPLIVHVNSLQMAAELAELPEAFHKLAATFWPGPLTLIVRKQPKVPDIVTAGKCTVALRMPQHPVTQSLLEILDEPLAAPSANPFGYISPSRARHVAESFGKKVPYIIDGGDCRIGLESTILDLTELERPKILRPGAVTAGQIETVTGKKVESLAETVPDNRPARAPGTFARHYSPSTRLQLFEEGTNTERGINEAILYLRRPQLNHECANCFWLSEKGDPAEVARSLFAMLRRLDQSGFQVIWCELPASASSPFAEAIRDRLNRAATK